MYEIRNFGRENGNFFLKKLNSEILACENFSVPQTRRQVSAHMLHTTIHTFTVVIINIYINVFIYIDIHMLLIIIPIFSADIFI